MKSFTTFLLLLLTYIGYGQTNFSSENYSITNKDLETNIFKKDSTAHALVIYEYGESYVDKNTFQLKTKIKRKIKILDREGFKKANIIIDLYKNDSGDSKEKISDISATTNNLVDGKISKTRLEKNQIFREKYNDNYTRVKFALPNIKEGSVITYSYTLESPFMFKYKGWEFQSDIPTLHSEYRASIPGNYEYNIKLVGGKKLHTNESKLVKNCLSTGRGAKADCFNSIYVMKDVPAFIDEDYMTTRNNYLARIDYELKIYRSFDGGIKNYARTWKTTDKDLKSEQAIGRQLNKGGLVKDLLTEIVSKESDPLTKAKAIYKYVQDHYTWNGEYNLFKEVSLKGLIKNKSGRASEINLLLFNLLKENDIDVKVVLISTRPNGLATKVHPVISDFNYLILQASIDGKTFLLDAVDDYLPFGQIPFRCLNQYGRLLDFKEGSYWLPISVDKAATKILKVELNFDENGTLNGVVESKKTGYHALGSKKDYHSNNDAYLKSYKDKHPNIGIISYDVATKEKSSQKFEEVFDITMETETIGDNIYLNPFIFKFITENPFKLQERTYPIDFGYKDAYLYTLKLNLNGKYDVVEIPESIALKLPSNTGSLILNTKYENDVITLFFKFNFSEAIYTSNFYGYLKSFFATIVDTQTNALIVLKNK